MPSEFQNGGIDSTVVIKVTGNTILGMLYALLPNFAQYRNLGASLVAQWLRIRLPVQGTRVRAQVWEDPTCRGATKPVCHDY